MVQQIRKKIFFSAPPIANGKLQKTLRGIIKVLSICCVYLICIQAPLKIILECVQTFISPASRCRHYSITIAHSLKKIRLHHEIENNILKHDSCYDIKNT